MISLKKLINNILKRCNNNYAFYQWPNTTITVSASSSPSHELTITSHGRPIYISVTGDWNPNEAGAWIRWTLYRDNTSIAQQIVQSNYASANNPIMLNYLDEVPAGTYTYKVTFVLGNTAYSGGSLNEDTGGNGRQSPRFTVFEI